MAFKRPRILLVGHTGQTAIELQSRLPALGTLVTAGRANGADQYIDLADPDSISACLDAVNPTWVINAAAYNQVDLAEQEVDLAMRVNGHAPAQMADWCKAAAATLIHYSTDYVFDGQHNRPYTETDATAPLSVYGESKLAGEQAVLESGCHGAVLRTSWVYSRHGSNFMTVMKNLLTTRDSLSIVSDQYSVPTWAGTLADLTIRLLQVPAIHTERQLFHACNSGQASRYEQVQAIRDGLPGTEPLATLAEIPSIEFPQAAARPLYSVMDSRKLADYLGADIPDWQQGMRDCLSDMTGAG